MLSITWSDAFLHNHNCRLNCESGQFVCCRAKRDRAPASKRKVWVPSLFGLSRADVVLVGPSRVAKSATCFYLAYRGIRAANVPLVAGFELPRQLLELDKQKVIGLTMNPARLRSIRRERVRDMGRAPVEKYSELDTVRRELRDAGRLIARHGWRSIDVSYKSVEEVARDVLKMIGR